MTTDIAVKVKVEHTFNKDAIESLLVGAFEGGSNYWIRWVKPVQEGVDFYDAPFGYGVRVRADDETHSRLLNMTAIEKGLQLMADTQPRHMADLLNQNDDATTSDVFLQLCLFGYLVYG